MKTENIERADELFRIRRNLQTDIIELGSIRGETIDVLRDEWCVTLPSTVAYPTIDYIISMLTEDIEKIDEELLTL